MSKTQATQACAVRKPDDARKLVQVESFIREAGTSSLKWYLSKDDDELNAAICTGAHSRVVFADLDELLITIWKAETNWHDWRKANVRIELAMQPANPENWVSLVDEMYSSLLKWRNQRRKRLIVAGAILSIIALWAMSILLFLIPPPR